MPSFSIKFRKLKSKDNPSIEVAAVTTTGVSNYVADTTSRSPRQSFRHAKSLHNLRPGGTHYNPFMAAVVHPPELAHQRLEEAKSYFESLRSNIIAQESQAAGPSRYAESDKSPDITQVRSKERFAIIDLDDGFEPEEVGTRSAEEIAVDTATVERIKKWRLGVVSSNGATGNTVKATPTSSTVTPPTHIVPDRGSATSRHRVSDLPGNKAWREATTSPYAISPRGVRRSRSTFPVVETGAPVTNTVHALYPAVTQRTCCPYCNPQ
ncbi:hypothetical protein JB92DRAFT_3145455 [Gautieria morchelliformis]|nr:hypothetical protein JB92DRAFT_3145455 [Gautieria morchelliformis]